MEYDMKIKNQKARLALILRTGQLRLWLFYPATRHYCYLSETGDYEREYNPSEFALLFHRDDIEKLYTTIFDICDGKLDGGKVEMRSRASDESERKYYEISVSVASRDDNGQPTSLMGIQHDVSEEYFRQIKINQLQMRYQAIFESSQLDMLYYDKHGVLTDINDRARQTFNVKDREQVLDGSFLLENNPFFAHMPLEVMQDSYTSSIINFEHFQDDAYRLDEFGLKGRMYYESTINPIRNEEGELEGIYMAGRDISEMVESFHRQQEGVRKLQKGTESIEQYVANIDYALSVSNVQLVNYYPKAYTFELVNRDNQSRLHLSQLRCIRLATPRFRRTVNSVLNRMDHLTKHGITQAIETEIRDKKGRQIWLLFNMVPMLDAKGQVDHYFGMYRDITNMKETEQRLVVETKKAQETELLKQAFLTNMSYEIRTPLNNIIGFAGLFTTEHDLNDEPFFVEQIKQNTNELLLLVNDILYLSRLDANMEEYKKEPIDFANAFDGSCQMGMMNISPGVQPVINHTYNSLVVDLDIQHVSIIIQRLCGLACQSTTHGTITADYEYHNGELIISIEDTGKGYTTKEMTSIFENFSRNAEGKMIGTGLDLPIVQLLVRQMGGTIDIQSDYGKGTSVWISIPCTASVIEKKRDMSVES